MRGNETILLVEDESPVRKVVADHPHPSGYEVLTASTPDEALSSQEIARRSDHLLLTDVVMPQLSGPQVARLLVQTRPDLRVLCVSGYTSETIVTHGILEGGFAFLQKPYTPQGS